MTVDNPYVNQYNLPFDNIMVALENSIQNGHYEVNNRNCHLSIIRLMATLELSIEQSNWLIGRILDGANPVTILTGFIIRFMPNLNFLAPNQNTINNARITLQNAYENYHYDRNSIAMILEEMIELPLNDSQLTWITNQITYMINPIQIMMWFLESFIINPTNNQLNNNIPIEYSQITIPRAIGSQPFNPLMNFNQMPEWFRTTILGNVVRSTGLDYQQVSDLFNQNDNIMSVITHILNNHYVTDLNILISYRDRNTNRQQTWSFRTN